MKRFILTTSIIVLLPTIMSAQTNVREKKWASDAYVSASVIPNFAVHHKNQLQVGADIGRNFSSIFYLGIGASYIQYLNNASALPVYVNPRIYFSRKVESWFIDSKIGIIALAPESVLHGDNLHSDSSIDGDIVHATSSGPYLESSVGYNFGRISVSVGADLYSAFNESTNSRLGNGEGGYLCGGLFVRFSLAL